MTRTKLDRNQVHFLGSHWPEPMDGTVSDQTGDLPRHEELLAMARHSAEALQTACAMLIAGLMRPTSPDAMHLVSQVADVLERLHVVQFSQQVRAWIQNAQNGAAIATYDGNTPQRCCGRDVGQACFNYAPQGQALCLSCQADVPSTQRGVHLDELVHLGQLWMSGARRADLERRLKDRETPTTTAVRVQAQAIASVWFNALANLTAVASAPDRMSLLGPRPLTDLRTVWEKVRELQLLVGIGLTIRSYDDHEVVMKCGRASCHYPAPKGTPFCRLHENVTVTEIGTANTTDESVTLEKPLPVRNAFELFEEAATPDLAAEDGSTFDAPVAKSIDHVVVPLARQLPSRRRHTIFGAAAAACVLAGLSVAAVQTATVVADGGGTTLPRRPTDKKPAPAPPPPPREKKREPIRPGPGYDKAAPIVLPDDLFNDADCRDVDALHPWTWRCPPPPDGAAEDLDEYDRRFGATFLVRDRAVQ